jgi:uncharacterized protein YukJ
MSLRNYGLLTGTLTNHGPQPGGNPHYVLYVSAGARVYGVALNVESAAHSAAAKNALQYRIEQNLAAGTAAARRLVGSIRNEGALWLKGVHPNLPTLDYVHGGVVDVKKLSTLPPARGRSAGPLAKAVHDLANATIGKKDAFVAVFGTGFPDQDDRLVAPMRHVDPLRDSFGFTGVDNVHMNQGTHYRVGGPAKHDENGPDQDGAVLFFLPDGKVAGCFVKFESQDTETDAYGNPLSTGIAALDARGAIPAAVRKKLTRPRLLRSQRGAKAALAPQPPESAPLLPGGASAAAGDGFVFNDPAPLADPNRPFKPDDDKLHRFSPFVEQFAKHGVPEPVPGPINGNYPVMQLGDVLGAAAIRDIQQAGQIVFHAVGDTGAPFAFKLGPEQGVADLMAADFNTRATADRPRFFFHLGDVVYFYGEADYFYDQFYKPYKDYPAPIFAIPGNHDGITYDQAMESLAGFKAAFCDATPRHWKAAGGISRTTMTQPGVWFTLDAPLVSIIGLYSNCSEHQGYLDDQQKLFFYKELVRLKADRQSGKIAAIILAVHHPQLSFASNKPSSDTMRQDLDTACQQAGIWPDAVLSGHAHIYQRATRTIAAREIPYIVSGSGGYDASQKGKTAAPPKSPASKDVKLVHMFRNYGYLRVAVNTGGRGQPPTLRIDFHSPEINQGQPADTCVVDLSKHVLL